MIDTYKAALDYLFPRITQIKFGLTTTEALLEASGEPQLMFPTIHVAGTNGKGSVSTLVAAALREGGFRVGLYTSPHLRSFRERIQVNGIPITEQAVLSWTRHLYNIIEATGATFFEITTAMAFADFAARNVDIAVVEVGLGGRLDSTNVLMPLVSVVTHIALDHQKYLGDTLELIAREKAGVAKPGVPFVIGEQDERLAEVLRQAGSKVVGNRGEYLPTLVPSEIRWGSPLGLSGPHQRRNAAVAAATLSALPEKFQLDDETIREAFSHAILPGRLDRRGKWLYDVAHNPDGVNALVESLQEMKPTEPIHALVSILGDKEWPEMLVALDKVIDAGVLTVAPSADTRKWDLAWLERWLADAQRPHAHARWRLIPDFNSALTEVEKGAGTILVTGSFHTVGDVMEARNEAESL